MTVQTLLCHRCGSPWNAADLKRPGFKEVCETCNAYLHSCKNCRFHQPGAHNECLIGTTEWVGDKEKANFCDEFEGAKPAEMGGRSPKNTAHDALDSLFGGTLRDEGPEKPTDFDSLFRG